MLEYLHGRSPRLIHRDVKPANILALETGGYALVDFGATRDMGREVSPHSSIAGTFGYMPPEQFARFADERSDLYALGVTLARLLSRREVTELLNRELVLDFHPWVNISASFASWLDRLVAYQPDQRFVLLPRRSRG